MNNIVREKIYKEIEWNIPWTFPALNVHNGIPISNGVFGAIIYGSGKNIIININRADFWDHRGELTWTCEMNYKNIKRLLYERNYTELQRIFEHDPGTIERPTRLPMGRYEIILDSAEVTSAYLDIEHAEAVLFVSKGSAVYKLKFSVTQEYPALVCSFDKEIEYKIYPVPVSEKIMTQAKVYSSSFRLELPKEYIDGDYKGWIQKLPNDPDVAVLGSEGENSYSKTLIITAIYQSDVDVLNECKELLQRLKKQSYEQLTVTVRRFWGDIWRKSAVISLEDKEIERVYYLGLYKMISISMPKSPAATLQGAWVEDSRMPPWSCDYHFNINVQECYWSAYASNNLEVLEPLVDMLSRINGKLTQYAKIFVGIDDGIQIPHAVDDRGGCMGGFWTGSIDHGSTAWIGFMLWQYYKFTLNEKFLLQTVFPFLKGTLKVYVQMLEEKEGVYFLPVSVSPEYGGDNNNAWGENASFQLANIHFLCNTILLIAKEFTINDMVVETCEKIMNKLPLFTKGEGKFGEEIFLWKGQPLAESHRHHSHLVGVFPFDIYHYIENNDNKIIIDNSFRTLADKGMGSWAGWSFPWAIALYARIGNGQMAELMIHIFMKFFMMQGYATSHDAQVKGLSNLDSDPDIMQVEAAAAFPGAILEMILFTSKDIIYLLPALPKSWKTFKFSGLRAENGFLISGDIREDGKACFDIKSEKGRTLKLNTKAFVSVMIEVEGEILYNIQNEECIQLDTGIDKIYHLKCEMNR